MTPKPWGGMMCRARVIVGNNTFTGLYDKGYHTGNEFDYVQRQGIEVLVAAPGVAAHEPDPAFYVEHFKYDAQSDTYTCPAAQTLTTNDH